MTAAHALHILRAIEGVVREEEPYQDKARLILEVAKAEGLETDLEEFISWFYLS